MVDMAKKLNKLVLRFQKKMGHLSRHQKTIDGSSHAEDETTAKEVRGKTATLQQHSSPPSVDLSALRNAMGLFHLKDTLSSKKYADDSNAKTSYKEDVKLEDRLALEAEEEKKVTDGDTYDDDNAAEAAAGVDKSSLANPTLSPKEQASQEMQSYNALISSESNRELSQIQEEISKATQSSMGKVSVVGQKENVQTESPTLPGLGDGGLAAALAGAGGAGGGLEGLGGNTDPILQGLQGSTSDAGLLSAAASNSEISAQQSSSLSDSQGIPQGLGGEQEPGTGSSAASINTGGQSPIEIGSSTPVDMGMFGGGASIQKGMSSQSPGESVSPSMDIQNSFMSQQSQQQQQPSQMMLQGLQGLEGGQGQGMQFKKSKISKKQQRRKKTKKIKKHKL